MRKLSVLLALVSVGAALSAEVTQGPALPPGAQALRREVAVLWASAGTTGEVRVTDGKVSAMQARGGTAVLEQGAFTCPAAGAGRLDLTIAGNDLRSGRGSTVLTVRTQTNSLSVFLRDVNRQYPVYLPDYGVVVTEGGDHRTYAEIVTHIRGCRGQSNVQRTQTQPDMTFDEATRNTREIKCQTWLGLGRDFRLFVIGDRLESITPQFHAYNIGLPNSRTDFDFLMGRGYSAADRITRRLEDGHLPILHGALTDDDIRYELTAFVTLEKSPLTAEHMRGTHYLVGEAYGYTTDVVHPGAGMRPWPEKFKQMLPALLQEEMNQTEETVLMLRFALVNTASVPRYAWFRNPAPGCARVYEPSTGFGVSGNGLVHSISTLDGQPLAVEEVGLLVKPGEPAIVEVRIPHRPISRERATALAKVSLADRQQECRAYWQKKLNRGAQIHLPDARLEEMVKAGLWHLDLVAYGREPAGPIAAATGVYTPIGSESAPIIQFFDSMGWHDVARRALMFFVEKQHADGHMQNYGDYEIETAGALHTLGEHYRYTRDDAWVKQIETNLLKACEWIIKGRRANQREELRGRGYGMMVGKVGDPQDRFHNFMFNGYHYVALQRAGEMLAKVNPAEAQRLAQEAAAFRQDIRTTYFEAVGKSPVMPLGDGTWCPTAPPWAEYRGALTLYADGGRWFTHGALNVRESVAGPQWLVTTEVLDPDEAATAFLVNFHNELLTQNAVAFSQPYYSQHPFIHLLRGESKAFLKTYFLTLASMADRQTYDFFEHFMGGPHKTHEEGQFLMQTRRMLYMERGDSLLLLVGIPSNWLANGKQITLDRVASYFGDVSLSVQSQLERGRIVATVQCNSDRRPRRVELRLPHPEGRKATWVKGGVYDPQTERVIIEPFSGQARVTVGFE